MIAALLALTFQQIADDPDWAKWAHDASPWPLVVIALVGVAIPRFGFVGLAVVLFLIAIGWTP